MKVKDLINELKKVDENLRVVVSGYEGGFNDVNNISKIKLKLNYHSAWYYGSHEQVDDNEDETAIFI